MGVYESPSNHRLNTAGFHFTGTEVDRSGVRTGTFLILGNSGFFDILEKKYDGARV
jgi:hypothetical protein